MGTKLSDLSVGTGLAPTDLMYLVDDSESDTAQKGKRITLRELSKALAPQIRFVAYGTQSVNAAVDGFGTFAPSETQSQNVSTIEFETDHIVLPAGKRYVLLWTPGHNTNEENPEAYAEIRMADEGVAYESVSEWEEGHLRPKHFSYQSVMYADIDLLDRNPDLANQGKMVAVGFRNNDGTDALSSFISAHVMMIQEFGV